MDTILPLLLIPTIAALVLVFIKNQRTVSAIAILFSLIALVLTCYFWKSFNEKEAFQFVYQANWIPSLGVHFHIGVDGISLPLVLLTNLLIPLILLTCVSRNLSHYFYALLFLMQVGLLIVFTSLDAFLFYVGWELALIPIYFICALWGGEARIPITIKFFIYTFIGSLFMLAAIIYLYHQVPTADFELQSFYDLALSPSAQSWVFGAFFIAFAVKIPLFPLHTWQPDTYTTAPAPGTMLLSGIMLKMGLYGLIRWLIPLAPEAMARYGNIVITLAIISIVYASIIALKQQHAKRLIAYSSIAHVGLIAAGIFVWNTQGLQGAIIQMVNHGINVIGLFLVLEIVDRNLNTLELSKLGGIAKRAPKLAILLFIILLGAIGLPLTNGFVGEFLLLLGIYQYHIVAACFAGLTIILGAAYMLRMYQHIMLGEVNVRTQEMQDVKGLELLVLIVIAFLVLGLGIYPEPLLKLSEGAVNNLLIQYQF